MDALATDCTSSLSSAFQSFAGAAVWQRHLTRIAERLRAGPASRRNAQQRHALELALVRAASGDGRHLSPTDRRILALAGQTIRLARRLPPEPRARLGSAIEAALLGQGTLTSLFHLLRSYERYRRSGAEVRLAGLIDNQRYDLLLRRQGIEAEVVCETVSAEDGRPLNRSGWCDLLDRLYPHLQQWLIAHPGSYLLKMTLPHGLRGPEAAAPLQEQILALLAAKRRELASAEAILKLVSLGAFGPTAGQTIKQRLRAEYGPDAHLAFIADAKGESIFAIAARASCEDHIAAAVVECARRAARSRFSGTRPGIIAMLIEDLDRNEWRRLRETLELEVALRRFLIEGAARHVVAASCCSRFELLGFAPPDAAEGGELLFRNPGHPAARSAALAPLITPLS